MYKIGDFSQLGQVSPRMLRHYDKLDLLKPGEIDKFTGYRYYTIEQLPRLNRIVMLRELGFSLEEIGGMLEKDLPIDTMQLLYESRKRKIEEQLREEATRLQRVSQRLRQIQQEGTTSTPDVTVKRLESERVVGMRQTVPHVDDMKECRSCAISGLYDWIDAKRLKFLGERVAYFNQGYEDEGIDMLFGVAVAESFPTDYPAQISSQTLPAMPTAASIVHHGSIYDIPNVVSSLYQWLGLNGYSSTGAYREIHHFGREDHVFQQGKQDDVVYEIVVPVEKF